MEMINFRHLASAALKKLDGLDVVCEHLDLRLQSRDFELGAVKLQLFQLLIQNYANGVRNRLNSSINLRKVVHGSGLRHRGTSISRMVA